MPTFFTVSAAELRDGRLSESHLAAAADAVRTEGYVVLEDVVDRGHLEILREAMIRDVERILARPNAPFNFNRGNIQQQPPLEGRYLFRDVLVNDLVIDVTAAVLGTPIGNRFYSGNTALPSENRQPVHFDSGDGSGEGPAPPSALVVNVPVVDMDERNGSTEIWPGTHVLAYRFRAQGDDIKVPADALEERRAICAPLQPAVRAGSVLIRDMRLWHAGMPNRTETPRPMIAMIHQVGVGGGAIAIPRGTEEFFEHPVLKWSVRVTDEPIDHISHGHAYDAAP